MATLSTLATRPRAWSTARNPRSFCGSVLDLGRLAPPPARTAILRRGSSAAPGVRAALATGGPASVGHLQTPRLATISAEFLSAPEGQERSKLLLQYAARLPAMPEASRTLENRVMGCTSQAWLSVEAGPAGAVISGDSDSQLTRGFIALLADGLKGLSLAQLAQADPALSGAFGLGAAAIPRSRSNAFRSLVEAVRSRAKRALAGAASDPFPSLLITPDGLSPRGAFAEAQAAFLEPAPAAVAALGALLREKKIGIVAHFYMDAEVQGVLTAARAIWPHIYISDSLVMADSSVKMVREGGCEAIAVLGVDFMSENVRAILDDAGLTDIPVYRMAEAEIGCTLAAAAEDDKYYRYLDAAAAVPDSLHVVYINTSLRTKALADAVVPTITCTSSNVLSTVLTAAAQAPGLNIWYGPDSYMGANLVMMLTQLASLPDADVAAVHPAHTAASLRALLPRVQYFKEGACMVHELFAGDVVAAVRDLYGDAFLTAHFEVPGEMFELALEARASGMGVVGSTQNILDFVLARTQEALERPQPAERLRFVLGTETGMVTSIVDAVQRKLRAAPPNAPRVEVEVIFPVSADAIAAPGGGAAGAGGAAPAVLGGAVRTVADLAIIPGAAAGEGCSAGGGCASCPYMKMNTLEALLRVAQRVGTPGAATLAAFEPRKYEERAPGGKSLAAAGCVPILHMRDFQAQKRLSDTLLHDIHTRNR